MKPNKLIRGNLIGVCAPSGTIKEKNREELTKASELLAKYELKVIYSENLYSNSLGYSATVKEKLTDFNQMIINNDVKAIIFAKGGANSNSLLDGLNYEKINPYRKLE